MNEKNRLRLTDQHYLKTNLEMSELFADLPEALENNYNFPLRCNFRPLFSNPILPNISKDKDGDADNILRKDSLDNWFKEYMSSRSEGPCPVPMPSKPWHTEQCSLYNSILLSIFNVWFSDEYN